MRFLHTLLLLLVLPGLLLPAGFLLRLCPCVKTGAAQATCCGPSSCDCCAAKGKANDDGDARGEVAGQHRDCKCPVLRGPNRKTEAIAPERNGDPGPQPIALLPEARPLARLTWGVAARRDIAGRSPPPPDRARNLPLLL